MEWKLAHTQKTVTTPSGNFGPRQRTDGRGNFGDARAFGVGEDAVEALERPKEVVAEEQVREGQALQAEEEAGGGWWCDGVGLV